jgi:hypothetical protein
MLSLLLITKSITSLHVLATPWEPKNRVQPTDTTSSAVKVNVSLVGVELAPAEGNNAIITNVLDLFTVRNKNTVVHPRSFI